MFCERCGGPIEPSTNTCKYCGSWNGQPLPNPQQEQPKPTVSKKPSSLEVTFGVLFGVAGIILLVLGFLPDGKRSLVWVGGALLLLAFVVPMLILVIRVVLSGLKDASKNLSAGLGSTFKNLGNSLKDISGEFFSRFGQCSFTNKINREKFDSIPFGAPLSHIEGMFGKGKQTYASGDGITGIKVVMWQESALYAAAANQDRKVVTVKFQDGKAVEKYQFGL